MSSVFTVPQKRQIVYTVLARFLKDDELLQALQMWERHYAGKPLFALNDYVASLARFNALIGKRKEVIRELVSLSQNPQGLLPDPIDKLAGYKKGLRNTEGLGNERLDAAFEHFLVALETVLSSEDFLRLRLHFLVSLGQTDLPPAIKSRLRAWFDSDGGSKSFTIACSSAEIRKIVNRLYVAMCEIFGPVRADDNLEKVFLWLERYQPLCVSSVRRFL